MDFPGTVCFDGNWWKKYFTRKYAIDLANQPTVERGACKWKLNANKGVEQDPYNNLIRMVVNSDVHLFEFCACMLAIIITTSEQDGMENIFTCDVVVKRFIKRVHDILYKFIHHGHIIRRSTAMATFMGVGCNIV